MNPIDRSRAKAVRAANILKNLDSSPKEGADVKGQLAYAAACLQTAHLLLIDWVDDKSDCMETPDDKAARLCAKRYADGLRDGQEARHRDEACECLFCKQHAYAGASSHHALNFLKQIRFYIHDLHPDYDTHPNGNGMVVFRTEDSIFTVEFSEEGKASWAVSFSKIEEKSRGHFMMENGIPEAVKCLIARFES